MRSSFQGNVTILTYLLFGVSQEMILFISSDFSAQTWFSTVLRWKLKEWCQWLKLEVLILQETKILTMHLVKNQSPSVKGILRFSGLDGKQIRIFYMHPRRFSTLRRTLEETLDTILPLQVKGRASHRAHFFVSSNLVLFTALLRLYS